MLYLGLNEVPKLKVLISEHVIRPIACDRRLRGFEYID